MGGSLIMTKNRRRSYDIDLEMTVEGASGESEAATKVTERNVVFLQDMICRYLWSGRQH